MSSLRSIRIAKIVALLGFLLPWLTVSCSGRQVASLSGWNLVTGSISIANPLTGAIERHGGSPSLAIVLAVLAIGCALLLSFMTITSSIKARIAFGASIGAIVLIWLGANSVNGASAVRAATERQSGFGQDMLTSAMVSVDYAIGFWVTLASLAVAAFLSWGMLTRPDGAPGDGVDLDPRRGWIGGNGTRSVASERTSGAVEHRAHNDSARLCPTCARRFSTGIRFCTADGTELTAADAGYCGECGTTIASDIQFCPECGTQVTVTGS